MYLWLYSFENEPRDNSTRSWLRQVFLFSPNLKTSFFQDQGKFFTNRLPVACLAWYQRIGGTPLVRKKGVAKGLTVEGKQPIFISGTVRYPHFTPSIKKVVTCVAARVLIVMFIPIEASHCWSCWPRSSLHQLVCSRQSQLLSWGQLLWYFSWPYTGVPQINHARAVLWTGANKQETRHRGGTMWFSGLHLPWWYYLSQLSGVVTKYLPVSRPWHSKNDLPKRIALLDLLCGLNNPVMELQACSFKGTPIFFF